MSWTYPQHPLARTHLAFSACFSSFARGSAILKLQRRRGNSTNIKTRRFRPPKKIRLAHTQQTQFGGKAVDFFYFVYSEIRCKRSLLHSRVSSRNIPISVGYQIKCHIACQRQSIIETKKEPKHMQKMLYWLWEKYIGSETCKKNNKHEISPA